MSEVKEKAPRQKNPTRGIDERIKDFNEVYLGFTEEVVKIEAGRCIFCKNPRCSIKGCPLHNKIPDWIRLVKDGKFIEAAKLTRETSSMPEICSRLCPQEKLCEGACVIGIKHEPVAIGAIERFANDYAKKHGGLSLPTKKHSTGKKVAAIGSGPSSLALAEQLLIMGHSVTIFEKWPKPGGVLIYGIPGFKIDRNVLEDRIELLRKLGAEFVCNTTINSANELLEKGYDAVFIGVGASKPSVPTLEGVNLDGVYTATEYLVKTNLRSDYLPEDMRKPIDVEGKNVVVLGGGDTAMDCARSSIRVKAKSVKVVYRRDEENMPGSKKEVKAAKEEKVEFMFLTSPVKFIGKERVEQIECVKMQLGEPDESGRRRPIEVKGSNFLMKMDIAVLAFGYKVEKTIIEKSNLTASKWGTISINSDTGATNIKGVFAGGDSVNGADLVVTATVGGRVAANGIDRYFSGENWETLSKGD